MRGQESTEPISAPEDLKCSFAEDLHLWFRNSTTAWLGTAAELASELKAHAETRDDDGWPDDAQALYALLENSADSLRSHGLDVRCYRQDNGPRLISIRAVPDSPHLRNEEVPQSDQSSNEQEQIVPSARNSDSPDWYDVSKSLSGFDTGNRVPTDVSHRMVITSVVILVVVCVLVYFRLSPGFAPIALSSNNSESQSNALVARSSQRTNDAVTVPQLLEQSRAGDADAQYLLGRTYEIGAGVEEDFVNAYAWYVIADSSGNPGGKDAARQLTPKLSPSDIASVRSKIGFLYASGAYVPRDFIKAYIWLSLAAVAGDPAAAREKSLLSQKMTQEEITEADNRASDWLKRHGTR
jgi:TPR repeat protein